MSGEWKTEDDEVQKVPPKQEFKVKAYLVLVDSDKQDWGMVEDTLNNLNWQPGSGEVVGTWTRPAYNNLIHISLGTALSALQDRSVQTFAHYAEERRQKVLVKRAPRKAGKAAEPVQEPVQELSVDEKLKFNALRARMGRAK